MFTPSRVTYMLICSFLFLILDSTGVDLHESQLDTLLILLILGPQSIHCVKKAILASSQFSVYLLSIWNRRFEQQVAEASVIAWDNIIKDNSSYNSKSRKKMSETEHKSSLI